MQLVPLRIEIVTPAGAGTHPWTGQCGGEIDGLAFEITADGRQSAGDDVSATDAVRWSVANASGRPRRVLSTSLVWRVVDAIEPLTFLRQGWQSWSPCDRARFGRDGDPSRVAPELPEFVRAIYHPDARVVALPDELRSEGVTLLADARPDPHAILVGFVAADSHDGTLRLRHGAEGTIELIAEAWLGGVCLAAGERRDLHPIEIDEDSSRLGEELLARFAQRFGLRARARTGGAFTTGWCTWYQYFHGVDEACVRDNLARGHDWPFDLFQIDDGFQSAIGDWLDTNQRFPSGLTALARDVARAGLRPGLWIAPFLVAPDSRIAREHPDWLVRAVPGVAATDASSAEPICGMWNPPWGGGLGGVQWVLDTTRPEVQHHLESVARELVAFGFSYLKLDFSYAAAMAGAHHDPSLTPAQRLRAGFAAIRRGVGEATTLLGCGAPLWPSVGLVDAMRIGPDVAPHWDVPEGGDVAPGYRAAQPAVVNALHATRARAYQHRRLWQNDPDCLLLRASDTALSAEERDRWAEAVGESGGLVVVSDDLARLGSQAREQLERVIEIARARDAHARRATPI